MYKFYILIGFFISLFIPRTKKIWVFGENELTVLKPFYEFSSIQNDGIKKIYISCDNKRIIDLQSKGFKAFNSRSFFAIYYIVRAKLQFICKTKLTDIHSYLSYRATIINLFHGTPLKAVGITCIKNKSNSFFHKRRLNRLRKRYSKYKFLCATSPFTQNIYSKCFGLSKKKFKVLGHPRNDLISCTPTNREYLSKNSFKNLNNYSFIFSYMPTWRKNPWNHEIDFEKMNQFLVSKKAILYIRPHHLDTSFNILNSYSNIICPKPSEKPIHDSHHDLLGTDALISDYSSLIHDFLLSKRPILAYTPDFFQYKEKANFCVDYDSVIPAPKIMKFDELIKNMNLIIENKYCYKKYNQLLDLYHSYKDKDSSSRLYQEVKAICMN